MDLQSLDFAMQKSRGSLKISSWVTVHAMQAMGNASIKSDATCSGNCITISVAFFDFILWVLVSHSLHTHLQAFFYWLPYTIAIR